MKGKEAKTRLKAQDPLMVLGVLYAQQCPSPMVLKVLYTHQGASLGEERRRYTHQGASLGEKEGYTH